MSLTPELVKSKNLRSLNEVLWKWVALVKEFGTEWAWEDVPWWYTERALISTLAAAVWKCGGIALEEYSNVKGYGQRRYAGRCDLYLKISNQEFIAEGKLLWSQASGRSTKVIQKVKKRLLQACEGIKTTQGEGERKLGIVFAVPIIPKSEKDKVEDLLEEWQKKILKIRASALAWVFPPKTRRLPSDKKDIYLYPGLAILIQEL